MHVAATGPGLSFAEPYAIGLVFVGLALFAAVGALSHEHDRAFSASLIYLGLGAAAAVGIELLGLDWLAPLDDARTLERASELAVVIALFGTGLKLDRELRLRSWTGVVRLLALAMPLTIAAVVLFGTQAMGLSLGAAIVLGAVLAPTDPVLAGDVGVGPPGDEEEREPNFSITGEAGLNDGLAFPFVALGLLVVAGLDGGDFRSWLLEDVLYAVSVGVALGAALGYGIAALAVWLRDHELLAHEFDGWLGIAAALVLYGAAEAVSAYGFLAAFVGGVAFRRYERDHEYNRGVHHGADTAEKFAELALVLLLGSSMTLAGLGEPGLSGWLLVPLLLVAIRPAAVLLSLLGARLPRGERAFVAWFGVRGIGSLYYAAVAVGSGALSDGEASRIFWTAAVCIVASIVVHGVTAAPLSARWLPADQRSIGRAGRPRD